MRRKPRFKLLKPPRLSQLLITVEQPSRRLMKKRPRDSNYNPYSRSRSSLKRKRRKTKIKRKTRMPKEATKKRMFSKNLIQAMEDKPRSMSGTRLSRRCRPISLFQWAQTPSKLM
jgi:hypothetical protein